MIGDRTKAALAVKRADGVLLGKPSTVPVAVEALILSRRAQGLSLRRPPAQRGRRPRPWRLGSVVACRRQPRGTGRRPCRPTPRYNAPPPVERSTIAFHPRTRSMPFHTLKVGDVILETPGYPVVITAISGFGSGAGRMYEVRWREQGKQRQRTFKVKRVAERFALQVESEQAAGASTEPLAGRGKTFERILDASLAASRPLLKPTTYEGYALLHNAWILPRFGKQRIAAVTSEHVERWVASLTAEGLATSTIRNHYVAVSKVFRYAVRHRLISHNPCHAVQLPRAGSAADFAPVFLTAAQVEAVAAELDAVHPYGTVVRFAAQTGLRSAEISGLRIRDVNLAAGHVEVRQTVKRLNGAWAVGTPKSVRSTRNVPLLSRALVAELRELLVAHPASGDPNALFFPGNAHASRRLNWTQPLDTGRVRRYHLVPTAQRLGIAEKMRFHDLRHTYASLMLAAGFKPYEVSRWMGHGSVATTDGIYGHLYQADYNLQIAQFEAFVGSA